MICMVVEQPDASLSIDIMSIAELVLNCIHRARELQPPGRFRERTGTETTDWHPRLPEENPLPLALWPSGLLESSLWPYSPSLPPKRPTSGWEAWSHMLLFLREGVAT